MSRNLITFPFGKMPPSLKRGLGIIAASTLVLTGCSVQDTATVKASNVLENVAVDLNDSAQVSKIHSTVISVDGASQESSSEENEFTVRDVVNDLPVRVTTHYQTEQGSGDNLDDLSGYTGQISIDVTVENLTVKPQELTYDVNGTQKKKTSLVGAPLSVAASTTFESLEPQDVLAEATLGEGKTNGIISTNDSGKAVVQWGKILAGPTTGTSTTFTVNLNADNFEVPKFVIAVHPGLSTDLSSSGSITSAFSNQNDSQLALMQDTVDLVAEANQTLSDASSIITQVRDNLNSTSDSLKSTTVKELQDSSDKLTGRLTDLQDKMSNLQVNLSQSAEGSQQQIVEQMQQTVESINQFLGQKGEQVPSPEVDAGTCSVKVSQPANGSTVYSNMVQLSSVLDAYSQANIDCQDQILGVVNNLLGPENPNEETCKDSQSASCSVYNSQKVTATSLISSVEEARTLADKLQPGAANRASENAQDVSDTLKNLDQQISALQSSNSQVTPAPSSTAESPAPTQGSTIVPTNNPTDLILANLNTIDQQVKDANDNLQSLEDFYKQIHETAQAALQELQTRTDQTGSMEQQNQELADQLCTLVGESGQAGKLSQEQVDHLRGYLTDAPCGATPSPEPSVISPTATPSPSAIPDATATATASATVTGTATATAAPTATADPSATVTDVPEPMPTTSNSAETVTSMGQSITIIPAADTSPEKLQVPKGYQQPMDQRLENQAKLWNDVLQTTDTESDDSKLAQKFSTIRDEYQQITDKTAEIRFLLGLVTLPNNDGTTPPAPTVAPTTPANPVLDDETLVTVKNSSTDALKKLDDLTKSVDNLGSQQNELANELDTILQGASPEEVTKVAEIMGQQARNVNSQRQSATQDINDLFSQQVTSLSNTSSSVSGTADSLLKDQSEKLNQAAQNQASQANERTQSALDEIQKSHDAATQDVAGASALLTQDLQNIMLDIGDNSVTGSGLLGSLLNNASNADNADFQLALATENATKYSNLREEDISALRLKQAQYKASLAALADIPAFHYANNTGAKVKTIYTLTIGGDQKSEK